MDTTIKTFAKPQCYLCGSEGKEIYHSLIDRISNAPGTWNLKMCQNPNCGLYWLDPMPFPEEIGKLYPTYYTHKIDPLQKASFWEKPKSLSKSFLCSIPGTDKQKIMSNYRYLENVQPGKLLDVGCGNGSFLKQMQARGWQVLGTDYDRKAVEAAQKQGLEAYTGDLSTIKLEPNSFDAITLNHVIEHLYDPQGKSISIKLDRRH